VCLKNNGFLGYNSGMDKKALLTHLQRETVMIWDTLCEIYTPLVHYNEPKVELNPYLWRCAGQCFQPENRIQMGYKFFKANTNYFNTMMDVILPHEIIHQADYNLFGESEKKCGHGENWQKIMLEYGLDPNPYHTMEISRK
jgi:predicted SprT family Zn-dependent metalloprotease